MDWSHVETVQLGVVAPVQSEKVFYLLPSLLPTICWVSHWNDEDYCPSEKGVVCQKTSFKNTHTREAVSSTRRWETTFISGSGCLNQFNPLGLIALNKVWRCGLSVRPWISVHRLVYRTKKGMWLGRVLISVINLFVGSFHMSHVTKGHYYSFC